MRGLLNDLPDWALALIFVVGTVIVSGGLCSRVSLSLGVAS
jgi:hypothetical protein